MTEGLHRLLMSPAPRTDADRVEVILDRERPPSVPRRSDQLPVWRTMQYTLDISSRFLLRLLVGKATREAADRLIDGYWRRIFRSGNAALHVTGRHHFTPGQPFIIMSNHGSLLDIPALMGAIPGSMRMVMKEELSRVPVWGQALVASGFVAIDRKNREKAIGQLEKAKKMLGKGISIWISPEGTRSRNGLLAPFKKGGFHLATQLGMPIIPAWIEGASDIVPPDQFRVIYDGTCTVRFGAPIDTAHVGREQLPELMAEVRRAILGLSGRAEEVDAERLPRAA